MLRYSSAPDGSFGFLLHELSLLVASRTPSGAPTLHAELIEVIKAAKAAGANFTVGFDPDPPLAQGEALL